MTPDGSIAGDRGLFPPVVLHLGPIDVTATVVYSLVASALVVGLAWLEGQRQELLREAQEEAAMERRRLLEEAEREARLRAQEQDRELAAKRKEALGAIRTELLDLALGLADRLLREAAGSGLQDALVGRLLEDLGRIPDGERERLRRDWSAQTAAEIETPHEIDRRTLAQVEAAIGALAGRQVPVAIRVEPALGCGLRLRMDGHLWDASLAGPLEELRRQALEAGTGMVRRPPEGG